MAFNFRNFAKRFFLFANIVVVFFFLVTCIVPYLSPQHWWFISFLALAFPFLLLLNILFVLGWILFYRSRKAFISGVALLFGSISISTLIGFHPNSSFNQVKEKESLRVVSWNVARFIELKRNTNEGSERRLKMMEEIKKQDADILCLQEFHTSTNPDFYDNISTIQKEMNYPYYLFSYDQDGDRHYYSSIIFSRYPLRDSGVIRYPRPTLPDVLLYADIKVNNEMIRIYTTHLQSNLFVKKDFEKLEEIETVDKSLVTNSKNILAKITRGSTFRSIQADLVGQVMGDSPYPSILCADLNDVPTSYTYTTIRGEMQDAFLKKGFGLGRTFSNISPTLRIDYIFADKRFEIKQFKRVVKKLSDHYMLVADIALKK